MWRSLGNEKVCGLTAVMSDRLWGVALGTRSG